MSQTSPKLTQVGGAVVVIPETCGACKQAPATVFLGHGHARNAEVLGWCQTCRDEHDRYNAWRDGLDGDQLSRLEDIEYRMGCARSRTERERAGEELADFHRSTGLHGLIS